MKKILSTHNTGKKEKLKKIESVAKYLLDKGVKSKPETQAQLQAAIEELQERVRHTTTPYLQSRIQELTQIKAELETGDIECCGLIGGGRSCDQISGLEIHSGNGISQHHALVLKKGDHYFLHVLGTANTVRDKIPLIERIKRADIFTYTHVEKNPLPPISTVAMVYPEVHHLRKEAPVYWHAYTTGPKEDSRYIWETPLDQLEISLTTVTHNEKKLTMRELSPITEALEKRRLEDEYWSHERVLSEQTKRDGVLVSISVGKTKKELREILEAELKKINEGYTLEIEILKPKAVAYMTNIMCNAMCGPGATQAIRETLETTTDRAIFMTKQGLRSSNDRELKTEAEELKEGRIYLFERQSTEAELKRADFKDGEFEVKGYSF